MDFASVSVYMVLEKFLPKPRAVSAGICLEAKGEKELIEAP